MLGTSQCEGRDWTAPSSIRCCESLAMGPGWRGGCAGSPTPPTRASGRPRISRTRSTRTTTAST
eukprot:6100686-Alexandrium_andersonii.AAC.1